MTENLLTPLDLAFWCLESPEHPMHLGALGVFAADSATAAQHAAELLAARSAAVPGLRMRIRAVWLPVGGAVREPARDFSPQDHVHLAPATADFHGAAGRLMERPLARERPPWEAHVLPHSDGTSFAVLFKFHHALADGLRALALAAGLMDPPPASPTSTAKEARRAGPAPEPARGGLLPNLFDLPDVVRRHIGDAGRALDIGAAVVGANLGVRTSPALTARPTGTRRTAGVVLDIDDVHRIRKTSGGTVNDVLLAVVAGALRRWLDERGDGSEGVAPRALIPVSRRRPRTSRPQGNQLSGYLIRLPVNDPDPLGRLRTVRTAMDRNKDAGTQRGAGAVALLADHVSPLGHRLGGPVVAQAARLLFDVLVTSVPLPSLGLKLAGCPLIEVYPFAPLAQGQSLAVAISTYRGHVHFGLVADGEAIPDLGRLACALQDEISALTEATAE
ncbi:wax ester/triacylglycerol synthase family O-acyltransferase [Streptomyces sp. Pv4-95]|uniref:wax ester/triacylglycerol synthase family O-acyltransferase n=1 Tax=Streptomyces sp. Pv4-95 TaxID=3049543 RepID=UPI003891F3CC